MKNLLLSLALLFGLSSFASAAIVDGCADEEGAIQFMSENVGPTQSVKIDSADDMKSVERALAALGAAPLDVVVAYYRIFMAEDGRIFVAAFKEDGWSCNMFPLNPMQAVIFFDVFSNPKEGSL